MEYTADCLEILRQEFKKRKITQKDLANKLNISTVTCQRIMSGESGKLKESIQYANSIMELTGLLPYQLLGMDVRNNPRLRLIDAVSHLSDEEAIGFDKLLSNAVSQEVRAKLLFSSLNWAEAHALISRMYHKIIKVNLTDDSFEPIEVYGKEWQGEQAINNYHKLSEWFQHFAESEQIHAEDKQNFCEYANLPTLKHIMRLTEIDCTLEYRRLINGEYRWVCMEVLRSPEYTQDNQVVLLCIKDIDNWHPMK